MSGLVRELPPVPTVTELERPFEPRQPVPRRPRPSWQLPAALAVAALLLGSLYLATTGSSNTTTTLAPPIPETEPAIVPDGITNTVPLTAEHGPVVWSEAPVMEGTILNDVASIEGTLVAVGGRSGQAAVAVSTTGAAWLPVSGDDAFGSRLDVDVAMTAVAKAGPGLVAIGNEGPRGAIWMAPMPHIWHRVELDLDTFPVGTWFSDVAGGEDRIVVLGSVGAAALWHSTEGSTWTRFDPAELADARLTTLVDSGSGFLVAGGACDDGICVPAIWLSADAVSWQQADIAGPAEGEATAVGLIEDVVAVGQGFLAFGSVDNGGGRDAAVWRSTDGTAWTRQPLEEGISAAPRASLLFRGLDPDGKAVIRVAGVTRRLELWDRVQTPIGDLMLQRVSPEQVLLSVAGETVEASLKEPVELRGLRTMTRATAVGARVIVVGSERVPGSAVAAPVTWTSTDAGRTWGVERLGPATEPPTAVFAARDRITLFIASGDAAAPRALYGEWDTTGAVSDALQTAARFGQAVNTGDVESLMALLTPVSSPVSIAEEDFSRFPTLGPIPIDWWSAEGGFSEERVTATIQYFSALGGSVALSDCGALVAVDTVPLTTIVCKYRAHNQLLNLLGVERVEGNLTLRVAADRVVGMSPNETGTDIVWTGFVDWVSQRQPEDLYDLGVISPEGMIELRPDLTTEAAWHHLSLARTLAGSAFTPGATRTIDSAWGLMEWTWITQPLGGDQVFADIVAWDTGFVGVAHRLLPGESGFTTVLSEDGALWREAGAELAVQSLGLLQPRGDQLFAIASHEDGPAVYRLDGAGWYGWSSVAVEPVSRGEPAVKEIVATENSVLLFGTQEFAEEALPPRHLLWTDSGSTSFNLAPVPWTQFITSDSSAPVITTYGRSVTIVTSPRIAEGQVWATTDGMSWSKASERLGISDVMLRSLVRSNDTFLALSHGDETCDDSGCEAPIAIWISTDGAIWTEAVPHGVMTTRDIGRVVSSDLGFVGIGDAIKGPRDAQPGRLWLSGDGVEWKLLDLERWDPRFQPGEVQDLAITEDTMVVVLREPRSRQLGPYAPYRTSLLVGRVIDPTGA